MTNLEALKELYVSMGGNPEDVADLTLLADVIAKLKGVTGANVKLSTVIFDGATCIYYNDEVISQRNLYKLIKGKTPTMYDDLPAAIEESDERITVSYNIVEYTSNKMLVQQFSARADSNDRVELRTLKTYSLTEAQ